MCTTTKTGLEGPEKKGINKLLWRVRAALKGNDGSKHPSLAPKNVEGPVATKPPPSAAGTTMTRSSESAPASESTVLPVEPKTAHSGLESMTVLRSQIEAERINRLGKRFKLPGIEAGETASRPNAVAMRVEKQIRIRIHRSCHKCQSTFGGSKICCTCEHSRCSQCPRYPPKKPKTEGAKGMYKEASNRPIGEALEVDNNYDTRGPYILTIPSRAGGQPLVRKKPMQRVRRTCHECSTLFRSGSKTCSKCEHVRCVDCPRDPAKKRKFPDGYPGDAYSTTSRQPLKYSCHLCLTVFPSIPHPESPEGLAAVLDPPPPLKCVRCGHERCSECPRAPLVKVEPAPDPEVLKSVEAKLAAMNVGALVERAGA